MAEPKPLQVTIAYSPAARNVRSFEVALASGATVADALAACGLWRELAQLAPGDVGIGIWGRRATMSQPLRPGDRIEVCRALRVDPKRARRERFASQGARASGLFAKKRAGAKAGY